VRHARQFAGDARPAQRHCSLRVWTVNELHRSQAGGRRMMTFRRTQSGDPTREATMGLNSTHVLTSMGCALLAGTSLSLAADVTPQRLQNPEPQNWLMNHRTYDGQRYSPLDKISKTNVKNLKLAYAVPLGGSGGNEWVQATPLAEDGFLYITDSWGVLYKIDGTSGSMGRIVWRMDPKQPKQQ